jgi:hypothetical protein
LVLDKEVIVGIRKRLNEYDTTCPCMDELKFIRKIMDEYLLNRKETIKLIQSVRRYNKGK